MERPNNKGSHNFLVGMFVLVALLVSAGFIVFMGSSVFGGEFILKTMFRDVRGLNVGAPVYLSGIQVGRVSDKMFPTPEEAAGYGGDPAQKIKVTLTFDEGHQIRVKQDSVATITTMGVLGDKVVTLTPGTIEAAAAKEGGWLPTDEPIELNEYFEKGGNLVEDLARAAAQLNLLLAQLNDGGKVAKVMDNLDKTTKDLSVILGTVKKGESTIGAMLMGGKNDKLANSLSKLDAILAKIENGEGTLGALVNDKTLHEDLKVLLGGAKRSGTLRFLIRQAIKEGEAREAANSPQ